MPTNSPAYRRRYRLKQWGLDESAYDALLRGQGGVCACCGQAPRPERRLGIHGDKPTREVYALICTGCRRTIGAVWGNFATKSTRLRKVADYLQQLVEQGY